MSTISAGTTTTTALVQTGDTTGSLVLQTGSTPTTAMTINSSQIVNFANAPTVGGNPLPSGAMTLISTQTASSSADLHWTGLSGYDKYYLVFENLKPAAADWLNLQVGYGATPTYLTSGYQTQGLDYSGGGTIHNVNNDYGTFAFLFSGLYQNVGASSGNGAKGFVNIIGTNLSSTLGFTSMNAYTSDNPTNNYVSCVGQQTTNTNPITAIKIYFYSNNIVSGKASLYGITS